MNTETNPFLEIKFHPSSLGELMTNLPGLTEVQENKLSGYISRMHNAELGIEKPLPPSYEKERLELIEKKNGKDEIPVGAESKLQAIFTEVVWDRRPIVETKYMDKGNLVEQDCLDLLSKTDRTFYKKNKDTIQNEWLIGTPDVIDPVIDTKACWDMTTFDNAKMTKLYEWQVKGYCWILGQEKGELAYCLVNTPSYMITDQKNRYWFKWGQPDSTNENWMQMAMQLERNMIFDWKAFRKDNPNWDFDNDQDFDVPMEDRVKRFDVILEDIDINQMTTRLKTCRQYLIDKWNKRFLK